MNERQLREISHHTNNSKDNYGVLDELVEAYEIEHVGVIVYVTTIRWAGHPETQNTFLAHKRLLKDTEGTWTIIN